MKRMAILLLVSVLAPAVQPQTTVVITGGDNGTPQISPTHPTITTKDGIGNFEVETNGTRAVRFEVGPGSPAPILHCNQKQMSLTPDLFYWISGTVRCAVTTSGNELRLRLRVLHPDEARIAAAQKKMDSTGILPIERLAAPPDYTQPVMSEVVLEGARRGELKEVSPLETATIQKEIQDIQSQLKKVEPSNTLPLLAFLAIVALAGFGWWLVGRPILEQLQLLSNRLGGIESLKENLETLSIEVAKKEEVATRLDSQNTVITGIGDSLREQARVLLQNFESLVPMVVASKTITDGLEQTKGIQADQTIGVERYFTGLHETLKVIANELQQQKSAVNRVESQLKIGALSGKAQFAPVPQAGDGQKAGNAGTPAPMMPAGAAVGPSREPESGANTQNERIDGLLKKLPQSYFTTTPGETSINRLDQAVAEIFRQTVPLKEGLQECNARVRKLALELTRLLQGARSLELDEKLKPLFNEIRQLQVEIEDLLLATTNNMRLHFDVEFYSSESNRGKLIDAIGVGLKKHIFKLEKPDDYFKSQFEGLAAIAVETVADVLDTSVDQTRNNDAMQKLFEAVLHAAGIEQIVPKSGEEFRAIEHKAQQIIQSADGKGNGARVERLIGRGFRRGAEVIRKASVIVCE